MRSCFEALPWAREAVRTLRGLRPGTSTGLGDHLDRVLARFAEAAPDTPVELVLVPTRERLEQVADGRLDAAFVRSRDGGEGQEAVPGIRVTPLWRDPLLTACRTAPGSGDHGN